MITLNHAIVTAADNDEAARFFAAVMGLEHTGPHPHARHFIPIRVNDALTLDFMSVAHPQGHHLAFDVDAVTFDSIVDRLDARETPYGDHPAHPDNGKIDTAHPLGSRGLYFSDPSGNLYELISPDPHKNTQPPFSSPHKSTPLGSAASLTRAATCRAHLSVTIRRNASPATSRPTKQSSPSPPHDARRALQAAAPGPHERFQTASVVRAITA